VSIGSEVRIEVVITNTSRHPVSNATAPGAPGHNDLITLDVRNSRGETLPEKEPDQSSCAGRSGCKIVRMQVGSQVSHLLLPGEIYRDQLVVSDRYDLQLPGEYTIRAIRPDDKTRTSIVSNAIKITVTP
jgi:hypothetical protein